MDRYTAPVAYTANGMLVLLGLQLSEWAAITGIIIGVATFLLNWYYKAHPVNRDNKD